MLGSRIFIASCTFPDYYKLTHFINRNASGRNCHALISLSVGKLRQAFSGPFLSPHSGNWGRRVSCKLLITVKELHRICFSPAPLSLPALLHNASIYLRNQLLYRQSRHVPSSYLALGLWNQGSPGKLVILDRHQLFPLSVTILDKANLENVPHLASVNSVVYGW